MPPPPADKFANNEAPGRYSLNLFVELIRYTQEGTFTVHQTFIVLTIAILSHVAMLSASATADERVSADGLVFTGRKQVDVMQLSPPEKLIRLSAKLKKALAENQDWFREAIKQSQPGKPLAYDERMGLTEDEYAAYLELGTKMEIKKVGTSWIEMEKSDESKYRIHAPKELAPLDSLEIDTKTMQLKTAIGTISDVKDVDAPSTTAFGAWQGFQWRGNDPNDVSGLSQLRYHLGIRKSDGGALMIYDRQIVRDSGKQRQMVILYYEAQ